MILITLLIALLITSLVSGIFLQRYVIPLRDMNAKSELYEKIFCSMFLISNRKALALAKCFISKLLQKSVYSINNEHSNSSNKKTFLCELVHTKNGLVLINELFLI